MSMVDWLLTEQLVETFREARAKKPELNAELVGRSEHGEPGRLAGAGTAARIDTTVGGALLVTPKRIARLVGDMASDVVVYESLVGYDWISPEMAEKVALKDDHYDRLYLYPRSSAPIVLDHLGPAVYPLMTFLGRVLEYRSEKVLRRKLDDDVIETLGKTLAAAAGGPFFTDEDLKRLFRRDRESMQILSVMWPGKVNLAAPELVDLLERVVREVLARAEADPTLLTESVGANAVRVQTSLEVYRRVATGEV